jgi:hypothetical protein
MTIEFDADKMGDSTMSKDAQLMPSGIVRCPNHGCALEDIPFPMPEKGTGVCPVSKALFEFEAKQDPMETVVMKDGTTEKMPYWEVHGDSPADAGDSKQKD